MLSPVLIQRYVRQILLPEIGKAGQEHLAAASFDLPRTGLAAATARDYLERAGVGAGRAPDREVGVRSGLTFALSDRGFAWSNGSPCERCLGAWTSSLPESPVPERDALAMAMGALAASQLMLAPLGRLAGAPSGRGVGFAMWPTLRREEIQPRSDCGCATVAGG
jgi:hypothetical protein